MNVKDTLLNSVTLITGVCAVVVAVHALRGESSGPDLTNFRPHAVSSRLYQRLALSGHRIGPADARLTVVEFGDFQCPVCGGYERVLDSMRRRHPRDFAVAFHEFPLSYHPLALPLARAAECAARQDRFTAFHDTVYAQQNMLGVQPVENLGAEAGVPDMARFRRCVADTASVPSIQHDLEQGKAIGIPGTPAIIVNGVMHTTDLSLHDLEELLAEH